MEQSLDILGTDWSVARYSSLLAGFYGFYLPLENRLARIPLGELGLEPEARSKLDLLEQDMSELGIDSLARSRVPTCTELPGIPGIPEALGCMYVLEGATLGGKVTVPFLKKRLDPIAVLGYRFLNPYGERTGAFWTCFCACLESYAARTQDNETMIRSACSTFVTLERWFQGKHA